jgi:hypothetical protein
MTRLERENKLLNGGWSQNSLNQALKRIDQAAALTQDFVAYKGEESPICVTSLGLIIAELHTRIDELESELVTIRRTLEDG